MQNYHKNKQNYLKFKNLQFKKTGLYTKKIDVLL